MFQSLTSFIAFRYSTAGKHNSFVSFINRFSVAGIALGLMALIVVVSVMNGLEKELKQRILGLVPHVVAQTSTTNTHYQTDNPNVIGQMPYRETEGVIQSRSGLRGVQIQGVEPEFMNTHSFVADNMEFGDFAYLQPGQYGVIIGRALSLQLGVRAGDKVRMIMAGGVRFTPFGRLPSQRLVTVVGIFNVKSQLDDKVVYMAQQDVAKLLRQQPSSATDTRLFLAEPFAYQAVIEELAQAQIDSDNWRSRQGPLFDAVKMEKNMMSIMLLLIIAVAAFNIVSALVMVVTEKQSDIAILQSQGMPAHKIMWVFVLNGLFNGIKGAVIGLVLGLLIASQLNTILDAFGVHVALSAQGRGIPVELDVWQVLSVTAFSVSLCLLASIYPAYRALKVNPATVLQNE